MFNLRNIVNKITDKGKESNPNSPGRAGQNVDGHYTHLAEGFLCPTCMKAFPSDTELQSHYESFHAEDLGSDQGAYGLNFHSLHQEVGERYKQQQDVLSGQTPVHDNISLITDTQELHKMLREVIASRASLQTEKDHLEQRAAQLAQLNVTLKAACDEGESSHIALKERLKVVEDQLTHRESIDDAAVLRQELIQVQRVMDELNREREQERDALRAELQLFKSNDNHESLKLQMETKDLKISQLTEELNLSKNEFAELSAKYQEEQASKSKRIDEVTDLKHQMSSLMENSSKTIESLKNELNKVSEEREALKLSLQDLQQNSENYKATSIQNVENILSQLESLTIRNEENESRLKSSQDEINMLTKQRSELKTDTIKKQQHIEESERLNESRVNKIEELKLALSQSREKITHLENEHSELVAQIQAGEGATTAIQQLTQENNSLQMKLREAREQHSKSKEELLQTIQDVKNQLSTSETEKQQLIVMLKDKEMVLNNVLEDLKASYNQRKSLDEQLSGKEAAIKDLNGSNQKLKTSIEELKKDYTSVQTALSEKTKELSDSTAKMKEIHEQLANNQLEVKNLQSVNDQLNENLKKSSSFVDELQASVKALMETKQKLEENVIDYEQEKEKLKKQCLDLETEKTKLEEANVSLNEKLKSTENQLQVIGVQRASLETTLFELQKLLAELEEEKKDLEEEMNKNISSLAETVKIKSELLEKQEEAVQMLMTERVQCRSQLETLEITHQVKLNELKEKQNELQKELETCMQKKEALEKDLTQETEKRINLEDALKRVSLNLETTVKESSEKQKALQRSLDEVSGEKLALEVQLEGSQTEQQTLLERCYASTSEAENLHRTIADLRHKLDESRAALHELGRENQTLQLDIDKLIGRKWAEDSEVTQCTLCHQNFSVLLRKHHCRNCGQIFCNECSSKTAPIANNKKPVRVCDSCFGELAPK